MKFTTLTIASLALFCAGCATKQEKILKSKDGATNVEFVSKSAQDSVLGFKATSVRVERYENSRTTANCNLIGEGFKAAFTAPAVVNLPSYGKQTKPIQVNCSVKNENVSETIKPANLSAENRRANAVGAGILLGGIVGGAVAGSVTGEKEEDAYSYKPIVLKLK